MIEKNSKASLNEEAFFNSPETFIHPTALISENVIIEDGVKVGPFCIITGNVRIESGTRIFAHVAIGYPAQVTGLKESLGTIHIKKNCEIREFVTIHASRYKDGKTVIGNNCYLMNYAHVSHDVTLEDNVTLINNVSLGGHTHVQRNAFLMAYAATHQFCKVGAFTAVAPFSGARQDLPPFCLFNGQPGKFAGLNAVALKRAGLSGNNINALKKVTHLFYQEKLPFAILEQRIQEDDTLVNDSYVQEFLTFVSSSDRGVSRKTIFDARKE